MAVAIVLHLVSSVVWVGGMFFAYTALRPVAAMKLEGPSRLTLWAGVFQRFFPWVWASVVVLLASGYWMVFAVFGGMRGVGLHVHLMTGVGTLMMLLFMYVYFAPYRRLQRAVASKDWLAGANSLTRIRRVVALNTFLGLLVIAIGAGGRYV
ncbi:MAG: CopD family protein [Gammaproteobacteria bacterium]|nr:CopD family protein [Gammaproteobacteria bacterium]